MFLFCYYFITQYKKSNNKFNAEKKVEVMRNVDMQLVQCIAAIAATLYKAKLLKNLAAKNCIFCSFTLQRIIGLILYKVNSK